MQLRHQPISIDLSYQRSGGNLRNLGVGFYHAAHSRSPVRRGVRPDRAIDDILVRQYSPNQLAKGLAIRPSNTVLIYHQSRDGDYFYHDGISPNQNRHLATPPPGNRLGVSKEPSMLAQLYSEIIGQHDCSGHQRPGKSTTSNLVQATSAPGIT
jgi:hypothetical protein